MFLAVDLKKSNLKIIPNKSKLTLYKARIPDIPIVHDTYTEFNFFRIWIDQD